MNSKLKRHNIYVKQSSVQGYGVFAGENIKPDEVIEECSVLKRKTLDTEFSNVYFQNVEASYYALCLGYGSIYNHSKYPNADFEFDSTDSVMVFRAIKPIKKDEEIFIYYSSDWFQKRGMKQIEPFRYKIRSLNSFFYFLIRFALITTLIFGFILLSNR